MHLRVCRQTLHEVLQLLAHVFGHAVQQRLHGFHVACHVLQKLVQALWCCIGKQVVVLLQEGLEIALVCGAVLRQQLVEIGKHLAQTLHVLGCHVLQALFHGLEQLWQRLLLQRLHQRLELFLGLPVNKIIPLQVADGFPDLAR